MPELTEVLLGAGAFSTRFYDVPIMRELLGLPGLDAINHLEFWEGSRLLFAGPILVVDPAEGVLLVSGQGNAWWLGVESDGPPVSTRRYCASNNKLSYGDFSRGELGWATAEDSGWALGPTPGSAFLHGLSEVVDDVLAYDESFAVVPGDTIEASVTVTESGDGNGLLRLRQLYSGRFTHPNLVPSGDMSSGGWSLPSDISISGGEMRIGEIPKAQFQPYPAAGFEWGDLTGWSYNPDNVDVVSGNQHKGSYRARMRTGGFEPPAIWKDLAGPFAFGQPELREGDKLHIAVWLDPGGPVEQVMLQFVYTDDEGTFIVDQVRLSGGWDSFGYHRWSEYVDVPAYDPNWQVQMVLAVDEIQSGTATWSVDDFTCEKVRGNVRIANCNSAFLLIPERTYDVKVDAKVDSSVRYGECIVRVVCWRDLASEDEDFVAEKHFTTEDAQYVEDQIIDLNFSFTPPSGYDIGRLEVVGRDVFGGSIRIESIEIRDADKSTFADDWRITPGQAGNFALTRTVPEGAETLAWQLVGEGDAQSWRITNAGLRRVCNPVPAGEIVNEFIGLAGLDVGDLFDAGDIRYDWEVQHRNPRQLLDELSLGGRVLPPREWRVNPDFTVDWGLPEELFEDRPGLVLTEQSHHLIGLPDARVSREEHVVAVKVVGAERRTLRGAPFTVTGYASTDAGGLEQPFGADLNRERIVEDGGIDHGIYADEVAADLLEAAQEPRESYELEVGNLRTLDHYEVGDWVYVYVPSEGIRDDSNGRLWAGRRVFPKRLRAIERRRTLGEGPFRVLLRKQSDASTVDVSRWVIWPAQTRAKLVVGNPRPTFTADPVGGGVGLQYQKFRQAVASR